MTESPVPLVPGAIRFRLPDELRNRVVALKDRLSKRNALDYPQLLERVLQLGLERLESDLAVLEEEEIDGALDVLESPLMCSQEGEGA